MKKKNRYLNIFKHSMKTQFSNTDLIDQEHIFINIDYKRIGNY